MAEAGGRYKVTVDLEKKPSFMNEQVRGNGGSGIIASLKKDIQMLDKAIENATSKGSVSNLVRNKKDTQAELYKVSGGTEGKKKGSFFGDAIGMIAKFAGPLAILIPVIEGAMGVLKPIMSILKAIGRVIGEVLRPVLDLAMALLFPILIILKPFVVMLRALLAPFRKTIMMLSTVFAKQWAAGKTGDAMGTLMELIGVAMLPISMLLMETMKFLTGLAIDLVMGAIRLIVDGLFELFKPVAALIDKMFGTDLVGGLDRAKKSVDDNLQKGADALKGLMSTAIGFAESGLLKINSIAQEDAQNKLNTLSTNADSLIAKALGAQDTFYSSYMANVDKMTSKSTEATDGIWTYTNGMLLNPVKTAMTGIQGPTQTFSKAVADVGKSAEKATTNLQQTSGALDDLYKQFVAQGTAKGGLGFGGGTFTPHYSSRVTKVNGRATR